MTNRIITLNIDSPSVQYLCKKDLRIAKVINMVGPITYELHEDSYRFLVNTIIGQMLSNKVSDIISARLETLCNGCISADVINQLSDEQLKSIGISNSKISYIRVLTTTIESGEIDFKSLNELSDAEVIKKLTAIRGIGVWTANMYLIFVLNRQDILPTNDAAFLQAYEWLYKTTDRSEKTVEIKCKKWKPYSSIAARYLYRALDSGLTKIEFNL
ncbi:MAG: DNA-3-methyladenine glycosylase 2 family protein [Clostridia bacterium]|nr:DNA-3-methyladenine glycosylase 2 family protein [Clostridia bacterium]